MNRLSIAARNSVSDSPLREYWLKFPFGLRAGTTAALLMAGLMFALRALLHAEPPNLTGTYTADDGGVYYVQQSGGTLWWAGMSLDQGILPDEVFHRGLSFTNVFRGTINNDYTVTGEWSDVTRGTILQSGTLNLTVSYFNGRLRLTKVAGTGGFGATTLTQSDPLDDTKVSGIALDIIDKFQAVHKNDDTTIIDNGTLLQNLKPYRDQTVFYGRVVTSHIDYLHQRCVEEFCINDYPVEFEIPHVNYGPNDLGIPSFPDFGRTDRDYASFRANNKTGDGDFDVRLKVDQDKLEPDFYKTGWGNRVYGPDVFSLKLNDTSTHQKLNYAGSDAYMGLETIMYGKADGSSPSLLPGWADTNGNSILLNGRPLNGIVGTSQTTDTCDTIINCSNNPPQNPNPCSCTFIEPCPYLRGVGECNYLVSPAGIQLGNLLLSAYGDGKAPPGHPDDGGTYIRVTGALVLDCGHGATTPCFDGDNNDPNNDATVSIHQNQEIHPVYSIDIINYPFRPEDLTVDARKNLTGAWGGSDGSTYYVRQIGNTIWWLGMMRDRQPVQHGTNSPIIGTYQLQAAFNAGDPACSSNQCWAFATVFKGTINVAGDTVEGDWAGVPQSTSAGSNGGHMKFFVFNHKIIVPATASIFPVTIEKMYNPQDATPPQSTLTIGTPQYPTGASQPFVTSATTFTVTTTDTGSGVQNIWYRLFPNGSASPPAYTAVAGSSATFYLSGADGLYEVDTYATDAAGNDESSHSQLVYLDNTAPAIVITQPAASQYPHSAILTLDYSVSDGSGSGVASFTPTMDGATTLPDGHTLQSGPPPISFLTEMMLGTHTFSISAADNLGNAGTSGVTFMIVVTPDSIKGDVNQFFTMGAIRNKGLANSLLAKLNSAAQARARGNCSAAANVYRAFINELQAQSGKGISPQAATIMITDAQYLIAHCP